jgi:transposase
MKATSPIDYKALYEQGLQHVQEQEKTIAFLHDDVTKCLQEQQRLGQVVSSQQKALLKKEAQIEAGQNIIASHEQTIRSQSEKIRQQEEIITSLDQLVLQQQKELLQNKKELSSLALIKHELRLLKKLIYGRRSEKHYPFKDTSEQKAKSGEQLSLNMEVDAVAICSVKNAKPIAAHIRLTTEIIEKKPHPGRHDWPKGLREVLIEIEPANKPEGALLLRYEDTRQLACTDMEFYLKVYRRYIYMAPSAEEGTFKQLIAPLPAHPIPKCKADISVLVKLVIEKFIYHLPTWRQQQRFKQYGIELTYNTLSNWMNRIADMLEPLYIVLLKELSIGGYLMMDETTYRVLDKEKEKGKKSHIGYLWACSNPIQKILAFSYQKGRGKKEVAPILKGFTGYLQTDGYGGYTRYGQQPGVVHLQCLAHARRYFVASRSYDLKRSDHVLEHFFAPLYQIEKQCKAEGLTYDQITEKRQQESTPVPDRFYIWLQEEQSKVISGTPIHKAIAYALNRFKQLCVYVTDGMLEIDNNFTERQIRPIALGRKNYLFAGSHRGGERAAILYSLLGTCKLQGIDPAKWLDNVLRRLADHRQDKLVELLPQFFKAVDQESTTEKRQASA